MWIAEQGKRTRDEIRSTLFKAVFGSNAYRAIITRRRRHRRGPSGGGGDRASSSSSSSDSDDEAAPSGGGGVGAAAGGGGGGGDVSGLDDGLAAVGLNELSPGGVGFEGFDLPRGSDVGDLSLLGMEGAALGRSLPPRLHGTRLSYHGLERMLRQQLSRGVNCLLVLDDCECLLGAAWLQVMLAKLLRDAAGVHILTTTPRPLGGVPGICTSRC